LIGEEQRRDLKLAEIDEERLAINRQLLWVVLLAVGAVAGMYAAVMLGVLDWVSRALHN
jgi:H+/Cl- antiporter ClcA